MTDTQLNLVLGVPMLGILANVRLFVYIATRPDKLYAHMDRKFEILTGKAIDIANRVTRIEARMEER